MKARVLRWLWAVMMAPVLAAYATSGCTTNVIRDVADGMEDVADDMDGRDRHADLGDVLSDWVEDW